MCMVIVLSERRADIPNGVLLTQEADAWILSVRWTVITTITPPEEPSMLAWIDVTQERLLQEHREVRNLFTIPGTRFDLGSYSN